MNSVIFGALMALLSSMSWAMCSLLFKKLEERIDPITLVTFKTIFGSFILFALILFTKTNINLNSEDIFIVALSGFFGIVVGDSLFFASLNRLSPMTLSVILFSMPILFSGLFGYIFLRETISLVAFIGILIILTGLYLLIFPVKNKEDDSGTKLSGIILAVLSLIFTTYSSVLIKPILENHSALTITMYRMFFSAILLIFYAIFSKKIYEWKNILSEKKCSIKLSEAIVLSTIGGFWFSIIAIKHCKLVIASSLLSLEPLFMLIFMIMLFKHIPKRRELLGVVVSIIGILICIQQ